ncbi:unnamed protein product [Musa acuminata subsp. burmannicoides]
MIPTSSARFLFNATISLGVGSSKSCRSSGSNGWEGDGHHWSSSMQESRTTHLMIRAVRAISASDQAKSQCFQQSNQGSESNMSVTSFFSQSNHFGFLSIY